MARAIKDSWLQEYLRLTAGLQSPEIFHLWVGVSTISATLERNIMLDRVYFQVYPNMYIILVAPPGKCGKNTAINIGAGLLGSIDNAPRFFAEKITPERILEYLSNSMQRMSDTEIKFVSAAFACAPELNVFMGKGSDSETIKLLTDLYDCKNGTWRYETKSSGIYEIDNPCLNLLAGSTPKWLRSSIPVEIVGGGFISRTVFVYEDTPRRPVAFPEDEVPMNYAIMKNNLIHDLNHIRQLAGTVRFTPEAKEWYKEWYDSRFYQEHESYDTDFFARWEVMLLKVAMVVSVAERDDLLITIKDLKIADQMLKGIVKQMPGVTNLMSASESTVDVQKILGFIKRRTQITHRQLTQFSSKHVKSDELERILQTLIDAGMIEISETGPRGGRKYRYVDNPNEEE